MVMKPPFLFLTVGNNFHCLVGVLVSVLDQYVHGLMQVAALLNLRW